MRRAARRMGIVVGIAACAVVGLLAGVGSADVGKREPARRARVRDTREPKPQPRARSRPRPARSPLEGFDPLAHRRDGDRLVSDLPHGLRAELTLDANLQEHLEAELARYEVPFGAVVAIEPATGRVRAYVSHSSQNPNAGDLCRDATPPAASVFKIVTGAALVDRGVSSETRVCYGGGLTRLTAADLEDDSRRDRHCETLATAMGYSINAIFAKLADRHLDGRILERYASAFGFGHSLPFDAPTVASPIEIPKNRLELARTAAGFWHVHMSPLHAALVAASVANDGRMPRASMVERVVDRDGKVAHRFEPKVFREVIPRSTARVTARMMTRTVSQGTARKWFFDPRGNPFLPGVDVAGKTGTLTGDDPYRGYTWWVGFAPVENPTLAVAALVVNSPRWRIKGSYLGREALRHYLTRSR